MKLSHRSIFFLLGLTQVLAQAEEPITSSQNIFRGAQYCEILFAGPVNPPNEVPTEVNVMWNGTGGVCPTDPGFYTLTKEDIQAVHGREADFVHWNGIRQWLISKSISQREEGLSGNDIMVAEYGNGTFPDGSGMIFIRVATVALDIMSMAAGGEATTYQPNFVSRFATFVWEEGTTVYELVEPNCSKIYTMQSFFLGRPDDPSAIEAEEDLESLSDLLDLPPGWIFRSRVLDADLVITGENGTTPVLSDDLMNTYSQHDSVDLSICPEFQEPDQDQEDKDSESHSSSGGNRHSPLCVFGSSLFAAGTMVAVIF